MRPIRSLPPALLLAAALAWLHPAQAATHGWPGAAPCAGTLQACIDGAGIGDTIEVHSNGVVNEALTIGKSLTLRARDGFGPALASGRSVIVSGDAASFDVEVSGLDLTAGSIEMSYFGAGSAEFTVDDNRLRSGAAATTAGIRIDNLGGGTLAANVRNNRLDVVVPSLFQSAIEIGSYGGTVQAQVLHNRIASERESEGWGILVDATGGSSITAAVAFNEVRGRFGRDAIGVSEGLFSSIDSSVVARVYANVVVCGGRQGSGFGFALGDGDIDLQLVNNTVVQCGTATLFARWDSSDGGGSMSGDVVNNLVAFNQRGMFFNPEFDLALVKSHNLVHGNGSNTWTPGSSTITDDPLLLGEQHPWLRAGSPAIDTGHAFASTAQGLAGLPQLDAAGLRRLKGAEIDIGAYEYGDLSLLHTATVANTSGHISFLSAAPFAGDSGARLQVVPNYSGAGGAAGPSFAHPLGVYFNADWSVFAQDFAPVSTGTRFNVFAPAAGPGNYVHVATPANISAWSTQLDHPLLNDRPETIVLATQNWAGSGGGVYNPHPIAVFYFAFGGPGAWLVTNVDQADGLDMPTNAAFNIYAQEPSPNAFRVDATADTRSGQGLRLDHPLLNDTPCAQVHVTRLLTSGDVDQHFDTRYIGGRWFVFHHSVPSMPLGSAYHVLVDPLQVHLCRGPLFRDGFE